MKLSQLLHKTSLICDLKSVDKNSAIKELLAHCDLSNELISQDKILEELFAREEEQSTGIGEGMAFPHARLKGLSKIHIVIGCVKNGMDFSALDKQPVNFIVLMLVDYARPNDLLKTRAAIAKLFMQKGIPERMLRAASSDELLEIIKESDIPVDYEITAKDIMRPLLYHVKPEFTIKDTAHTFHKHHIDSLPVIDDDRLFYGVISCYDLFSYGLPDFFNNLEVISFVKHMNPFEKYFDVDRSLCVLDLIAKKPKHELVVSADSTLMEIIFEMTVKNKEFLYVLSDDGKIKGVLDRYSIIDKIILAV